MRGNRRRRTRRLRWLGYAQDLSRCPYFKGTGYCRSGCQTEPSCQTDRPLGGWPSEVRAKRRVSAS